MRPASTRGCGRRGSAMSTTTEMTKEQVVEAIRSVQEPEVGRGLVELNMVPTIEVDGQDVLLTVELLAPLGVAPQRGRIEEEVRAALARLPGVGEIDVRFTSRVRASGAGKMDATPIKGVKNTIA